MNNREIVDDRGNVDKFPPTFEWTDNKVAEVARIISDEKSKSSVWTSDYTAEKSIIRRFKIDSVIREKRKDIEAISIGDNTIVVDKNKLDELIKYLSNYQAELQTL